MQVPIQIDRINQNITPIQYPPEVNRAIRNAIFIAHHHQNEREYNQVNCFFSNFLKIQTKRTLSVLCPEKSKYSELNEKIVFNLGLKIVPSVKRFKLFVLQCFNLMKFKFKAKFCFQARNLKVWHVYQACYEGVRRNDANAHSAPLLKFELSIGFQVF